MKHLSICFALVLLLASFAVCVQQAEAASTAQRQAVNIGVASGAATEGISRSSNDSSAASSGQQAASVPMQNAEAMVPQRGVPTAGPMPNYGMMPRQELYRPATRQAIPQQAPPAWSQEAYPEDLTQGLEPFGASLFRGNFANTYQEGLQSDYIVSPGDRIMLRVWGAVTYDDILIVDQQGNIFVPEVGPIGVGGMAHSQVENVIRSALSQVFTSDVQIYTNLMSSQPVAVFVTGHVASPGRYAGGQHDSVLYYLDRAGGIEPNTGSYRNVVVKRNNRVVASIDLYDFLTDGVLPSFKLQSGDIVLVRDRGYGIAATGLIRQPAFYEFDRSRITGQALINVAWPQPCASHVSVSGTRKGAEFHTYMSMDEFRSFRLYDEDVVEFHADTQGETIMVGAAGAILGSSRFPVRRGTTLTQLLQYIKVDGRMASTDSVYLRRKSVADQQKKTIQDSLIRLEQRALTATSQSNDEAGIRLKEAELIQNFVQRASAVEPDGVVVVCSKGKINDCILEEGDVIYVPQKSDVVHISGEVTIPKAVVYDKSFKLEDYVENAGGYTDRADRKGVLVLKPNGEVGLLASLGVGPGDQVMVLPEYDPKTVQSIKDIVQIIYQMAVSAGVVLIPFWS